MKKFFLAGVLGSLLGALPLTATAAPKPDATKAPVKVPLVTRDNFVSVELFRRADSKSAELWLRLDNSGLRVKFELPRTIDNDPKMGETVPYPYSWSEPAPMSTNQTNSFLKVLNTAQLPNLVGRYHRGKSSVIGLAEVLVLTISDEKDRDRKFEIQNSIDAPPRGYLEVVAYLRNLQVQKFSDKDLPIPDSDWVTRDNFQSLTLETSGGFAGTRSLFEIKPRPSHSSLGGWIMSWSQTTYGLKQVKEVELGEIGELILQLNTARMADINGKNFQQPNLADGFNEVLTLALSNGKKFTVSNYGDTAPPEYSALVQYLSELKNKSLATQ